MSRVAALLVLALGLAAFSLPTASANSLSLGNFPSEPLAANGTQAIIKFTVDVTVDQNNCAGGANAFPVYLEARLNNTTGPLVGIDINPASFTVPISATDTVGKPLRASQDVTLVVHAQGLSAPLDAQAIVSARAEPPQCTVPVAPAGSFEPVTAMAIVQFDAATRGPEGPTEQPVPGLAVPLVALGLVAVALLRRRA